MASRQLSSTAVVEAARGWIGTPYRHQASLKGVGTDCLGLVRGVWREVVGTEPEAVPAYSPSWAEAGGIETLAGGGRRHMLEVPREEFRPGDVLLFRWRHGSPAKHAGLATARDHMIHAQEGCGVVEVSIEGWWLRHLAFAFRFPGVNA